MRLPPAKPETKNHSETATPEKKEHKYDSRFRYVLQLTLCACDKSKAM